MSETIITAIPAVGDWFANADGRHLKVACWATVEIVAALDPEDEPERWRVIKAVCPGVDEQLIDLADVHPIDECRHETAPTPIRSRRAAS